MARKDKHDLVAKFDYYATEPHELTILRGERLTLLDDSLQWWQVMNSHGEIGYVPSNYVRPAKQTILENLRNTLTWRRTTSEKPAKNYTPILPCSYKKTETSRQLSMPVISPFRTFASQNTITREGFLKDRSILNTIKGNERSVLCLTNTKHPHVATGGPNVGNLEKHIGQRLTNKKTQVTHIYNEGSTTTVPMVQSNRTKSPNLHQIARFEEEQPENLFCLVVQPYEAQLADELSIRPGDRIHVYKKSADGWWFGALMNRGCRTVTGWFPSILVRCESPGNPIRNPTSVNPALIPTNAADHQSSKNLIANSPTLKTASSDNNSQRRTALTLHPYWRNHLDELSFQVHEVLEVITQPPMEAAWWRCRNTRGEVGWAPRNYLVLLPEPENTDILRDITELASASPNQFDSRDTCRSKTCNVDSELLRMVYAKRSKWANVFLTKPWFWGSLSRAECERVLRLFAVPGEFVLRDSESDQGNLTITMNTGKRNRNFKVFVRDNGYRIGYRVFNTMDDLIRYYQSHIIFTDDNQRFFLTQAFVYPGTPELELDRSDYTVTFRPYDSAHPGYLGSDRSNIHGAQTLPHQNASGRNL
ncbi:hypothetical protein FGIG_03876 [Fasciola gigantica]|uniref:Uncharacterized protein n=1 Tax=Fasciola gigantica TaxID=46835 RepID=A0A504YTG4_FASGI|nr:hypothetical protein FGIG_03876 [Fasciola gigantica]